MRTLVLCSALLILTADGEAAPTESAIARYEKLLARSPGGLAAETRLASWCEERGLDDRAQKHWLRTLCFDAQNKRALKRLQLEPLLSVDDDPAIKAKQEEAVDKLAGFDIPPANFVLAWHALASASPEVRDKSLQALREKPERDYVPFLLSALSLPVELGVQRQVLGKRVMNHYTIEQEQPDETVAQSTFTASQGLTPSQFVGVAFGKSLPYFVPADTAEACGQIHTRVPAHWNPNITPIDTRYGANPAFVAQLGRAIQQASQDKARARNQVRQLNQVIGLQNQRVAALLQTATGADLASYPKDWWQWWGQRASSESPSPDSTHERRRIDSSRAQFPEQTRAGGSAPF